MGRLLDVDLGPRTARLVERFVRLRDRHVHPCRAVDPLAPETPS